MRILRLELTALPGIDPPFEMANFDPGVNIVSGPNAVGKSSVLRTVRYLVSEPNKSDPAVSVSADFEDTQGRQWSARRLGSDVEWRCEGSLSPKPRLPDSEQMRSYLISLENLLAAQDNDGAFAAEVGRALRGGYDIESLRNLPEFRVGPRAGKKESGELRRTLDEQRKVEKEYQDLHREEQSLDELDRSVQRLRKQAHLAPALEDALDLIGSQRRSSVLTKQLAEFPIAMDTLSGTEGEDLKALQEKQGRTSEHLVEVQRGIEECQSALRGAALSDPWPRKVDLSECSSQLQDAKMADKNAHRLRADLPAAKAKRDFAAAALSGMNNGPGSASIDPQTISAAENLALRVQETQAKVAEYEAQSRDAPAAVPETDIDRLLRGAAALRAWEAEQRASLRSQPWALYAALVAGLGAALAAVAAAAWLSAGLGVLAALAVVLYLIQRPTAGEGSRRDDYEKEGLSDLGQWESPEVRARLREIEGQIQELRNQQQAANRAGDAHRHLVLARRETDRLAEEQADFARQHGLQADFSVLGVAQFMRLAADFQRESVHVEALRNNEATLNSQVVGHKRAIREVLRVAGLADLPDSVTALESGLRDLTGRFEDAEAATSKMDQLNSEYQHAVGGVEEAQTDLDRFWGKRGLEPGDELELRRQLSMQSRWRELQQEQRSTTDAVMRYRNGLESDPALLALADAQETEELEERLGQAHKADGEREQAVADKAALETRLNSAGTDLRLEKAAAESQELKTELADRREESLVAAAGQFLLADIESSHRDRNEPEIMTYAREEFERFTHHEFTLDMDLSGDLMARDRSSDEVRTLVELSSATRMQLLLAVRMAWARHIERDVESLPLFLDEALTASDPRRFAEIVRTLHQMSTDDHRQVFYLTARRDDVDLWRRSTGEDVHHIDIGEIRGLVQESMAGSSSDYRALVSPEIPRPGEMTADQYAELLQVPKVDPWRGSGAVHIFWVLRDDLDLLYRLLSVRHVQSVGQLESLLASPAGTFLGEQYRSRLKVRCRTVSGWVESWLVGRGRSLDRLDIAGCPEISDRFRDGVVQLTVEANGSAEDLVEILDSGSLRGFGSVKVERFETWLTEEGFIDRNSKMDSEERLRRVVAQWGDEEDAAEVNAVVHWLEAPLQHG